MKHDWELLLTNNARATVGALYNPVDLKYTRVENGAYEVSFKTNDPADLNLVEVLPHKGWIKAYRDNALRFWGRIQEPLVIGPSGAEVIAKDPWSSLNVPAHVEYDFVDATLGDILTTLKADEGILGYHPFNLFDIDDTSTATFTAKLKIGQRLSEFVESLASSNTVSGSWFRVEPQDDPDKPAIVRVRDFSGRVDNAQARWEYGEKTLDNVTDFEVQHRGLVNYVRVYYAGGDYVEVFDEDSIDEYGLVEKWFRRPGVHDEGTATKIANSKLRVTPFTIGSFEPGPNAPAIFDDFDVGDVCRAYFQMGAPNWRTGRTMYYKADDLIPGIVEVTIDESGVENMAFGDGAVKANRRSRRHSYHGTWRRRPGGPRIAD